LVDEQVDTPTVDPNQPEFHCTAEDKTNAGATVVDEYCMTVLLKDTCYEAGPNGEKCIWESTIKDDPVDQPQLECRSITAPAAGQVDECLTREMSACNDQTLCTLVDVN